MIIIQIVPSFFRRQKNVIKEPNGTETSYASISILGFCFTSIKGQSRKLMSEFIRDGGEYNLNKRAEIKARAFRENSAIFKQIDEDWAKDRVELRSVSQELSTIKSTILNFSYAARNVREICSKLKLED